MGSNWGKQKKVKIKKKTLAEFTGTMKQIRAKLAESEKDRILAIINERERCANIARDFDTIGDPINWPSLIAEKILKGDQYGYTNEETA